MDVSVIIPTLNRVELLEKFFFSLKNQTLEQEKYEVIVIDNGSSDTTKEVCKRWKRQLKNFIYIYDSNPGLHVGRNIGYLKSQSDIIVFADDDIVAMPTWLESIVNGFNRYEDVVLIGGSDIPLYEEEPPKWIEQLWCDLKEEGGKVLVDYSCILLGELEKEINPYYVFGCNFAVRKWVLTQTHGFHPDGMPEHLLCFRGDGESYVADYIMKNQLRALYVPQASVFHAVTKKRMNYEYIRKIAYRNGISKAYTLLREKESYILKKEIWKAKLDLFVEKIMNRPICAMKKESEIEGMYFLLKESQKCKEVQEWIRRENYLEKNGVIPNEKKDC